MKSINTKLNKKYHLLCDSYKDGGRCSVTYRDKEGRWTERIIRVEEVHRDHVIARCEMRGGEFRRFNLDSIHRVRRLRPPFGRLRSRCGR